MVVKMGTKVATTANDQHGNGHEEEIKLWRYDFLAQSEPGTVEISLQVLSCSRAQHVHFLLILRERTDQLTGSALIVHNQTYASKILPLYRAEATQASSSIVKHVKESRGRGGVVFYSVVLSSCSEV